jgi:ABC-2 type transport system ATP-binding protein
VAIIDRGRLVAQGSLDELRAGVLAQNRDTSDGREQKLTLEQIFLRAVGGSQPAGQELSWLS